MSAVDSFAIGAFGAFGDFGALYAAGDGEACLFRFNSGLRGAAFTLFDFFRKCAGLTGRPGDFLFGVTFTFDLVAAAGPGGSRSSSGSAVFTVGIF